MKTNILLVEDEIARVQSTYPEKAILYHLSWNNADILLRILQEV